jgi:hypothetical protein
MDLSTQMRFQRCVGFGVVGSILRIDNQNENPRLGFSGLSAASRRGEHIGSPLRVCITSALILTPGPQ